MTKNMPLDEAMAKTSSFKVLRIHRLILVIASQFLESQRQSAGYEYPFHANMINVYSANIRRVNEFEGLAFSIFLDVIMNMHKFCHFTKIPKLHSTSHVRREIELAC